MSSPSTFTEQFTWLLLLALFWIPVPSLAATWETLFMPGAVIEAHQEFESDCSKCHAKGRDQQSVALCLDCHEPVALDIEKHSGYHGQIQIPAESGCISCHREHRGRGAPATLISQATFDHEQTDFPLEGAHGNAPCGSCHEDGAPRSTAPSDCKACHGKQDVHDQRLADRCQSCHNTSIWNKTRFDHDKSDFPLTGKHSELVCNACHQDAGFNKASKACAGCHLLDDTHAGVFGDDCADCHDTGGWPKTRFHHDESTGFSLSGAHLKVSCSGCHREGRPRGAGARNCMDCHGGEDVHEGVLGSRCNKCHTAQKWSKQRFRHDAKTGFVLRGKHNNLKCESCHDSKQRNHRQVRECAACHLVDDPHRQALGKACNRCHNEEGWGDKVVFDHGTTRFPLIGLHGSVACESCHLEASYQLEQKQCADCHDDAHQKQLGSRCESCHTPNDWLIWSFDHLAHTDFPLEGAHQEITCVSCHQEPEGKVSSGNRCIGCHRQDDVHDQRFGEDCGHCHTSSRFSDLEPMNRSLGESRND